jgi:hypothetical protein
MEEKKQQILTTFREMENLMRTYEEGMKVYTELENREEVRTIFKKAKGTYAEIIDLRIRGLHCCIYLSDIPECVSIMDNIKGMLGRMRYLKHSI